MGKWEYYKEIIDIFASGCTLAMVVVLTIVFMAALLSPDKRVTIDINAFGEAWFELPIVILVGIGAVRNLYRQFKDLERVDKE
jgi:hypothetical protein